MGAQRCEERDIVIADGVITEIGTNVAAVDDDEILELAGHLVIPGLANCHTHSNENWFRGKFDNLPLEPWMIYAYPTAFGPAPTPRDVYLRTLIGAIEAARTGTTCVVDFIYEFAGYTEERLGAMVQAYRDVGIRAQICIAIADRPFRDTVILDEKLLPAEAVRVLDAEPIWSSDDSLSFVRRMVEKFHDPQGGIAIGLGPSGPQRCTDEMLTGSRRLADELDLQIHTHVLETKMQRRSGLDMYGKSIVAHLADIDFLSPRTHLVHGVWLSDEDVDILAGSGASVVHNPISNLKLGSGVSPITALRTKGVPVSLGTDGMCAGDGQNMLEAMKLAAILHKVEAIPYSEWLGGRDSLEMATLGGAVATGGKGQRGRIEVGQQADLLVFDMDDYAFTPLNEPILHVTLQIPTQALTHVFVRGEVVVEHRRLTGLNEKEVLREARERATEVLEEHTRAFDFGDLLIPSLSAGWQGALAWDSPVNRYLG
ncbi:amidohydrolase [Mycolicibacterium murale]|uniref:amidohydrolase family protein n=1 Tax=Mycolicibacterium murale TaxID=182220 RepID=UPI001875A7E3|nr:amidohydrolase [Mycolicibacterium murale]MCV7180414.1 amidohydrolase [Mycolicibacterium murale]